MKLRTNYMKKYLFAIILSFVAMVSNAQTQRYLCEIKSQEKELSTGLKIVFDFGSNPTYVAWGLNGKQKLVDENGKEIPFNSMVDAGNYMTSKGWNFLQAYASVYGGNVIVHWIFYKDADSLEKAIEGIMTKEMFKKKKKAE